jgi:hypothetical protein
MHQHAQDRRYELSPGSQTAGDQLLTIGVSEASGRVRRGRWNRCPALVLNLVGAPAVMRSAAVRSEIIMERDDLVLLHEPDLMLAVLRVAAARAGTLDACIEHLRELRDRAKVEHRVPEADVRAKLQAITAKLDRASLIDWPQASRFRITARGRQVLAEHSSGVDDSVLVRLNNASPGDGAQNEVAPLEALGFEASQASAYDAGYQAFGEGLSFADNPHPRDARGHLDWQNGWSLARDDAAQAGGRRVNERAVGGADSRRETGRASGRWPARSDRSSRAGPRAAGRRAG